MVYYLSLHFPLYHSSCIGPLTYDTNQKVWFPLSLYRPIYPYQFSSLLLISFLLFHMLTNLFYFRITIASMCWNLKIPRIEIWTNNVVTEIGIASVINFILIWNFSLNKLIKAINNYFSKKPVTLLFLKYWKGFETFSLREYKFLVSFKFAFV